MDEGRKAYALSCEPHMRKAEEKEKEKRRVDHLTKTREGYLHSSRMTEAETGLASGRAHRASFWHHPFGSAGPWEGDQDRPERPTHFL